MLESESVIQHYGTKGMKWGVRHDPGHEGDRAKTRKIQKLDQKFDRRADAFSTFAKVNNLAAKRMNETHVARINNKPEYKGVDFTRDSPIRQKYYKEFQNTFLDELESAAGSFGKNASGTKKYGVLELPNGTWRVITKDVNHAEETAEFELELSSDGHILSIMPKEILHYGVKGMKWGRRKEENAGPAQIETIQKTPGSRVKIKATKGGGLGPAQDAIDAKRIRQTAKKSGPNALSNKELQALVTRLNLERQYAQLTPADQGVIKLGSLYAKKLSGLGRATNEAVQYANSPAGKLIKTRLAGG